VAEVGSVHLSAGDDRDAATELFPERRLKMTLWSWTGPSWALPGRRREGRGIGLSAQFGLKPLFFFKTFSLLYFQNLLQT
jgi:hypothetical protein